MKRAVIMSVSASTAGSALNVQKVALVFFVTEILDSKEMHVAVVSVIVEEYVLVLLAILVVVIQSVLRRLILVQMKGVKCFAMLKQIMQSAGATVRCMERIATNAAVKTTDDAMKLQVTASVSLAFQERSVRYKSCLRRPQVPLHRYVMFLRSRFLLVIFESPSI